MWLNGTTLTATASATGGATTQLIDSSIVLPINWDTVANKAFASDTAGVRLTVAPTAVGALSGDLTVTLTGPRSNGIT